MSGRLYIGLMCGTSLDAIDVALIQVDPAITVVAAKGYPFPAKLRLELLTLCQGGDAEIERMGRADRALGRTLAHTVQIFLAEQGIDAAAITAIGSHGQTIRHRPPQAAEDEPFTLQIGDPNTLAEVTGITTVADFRRRDIAAGGQGAPLVPAFHHAAFSQAGVNRVIANIGGMANVTLLGADGQLNGFDTGPGNVLMDSWIQHTLNKDYDANGDWAASGKVHSVLLNQLLANPYYRQKGPKSTGREHYNLSSILSLLSDTPAPAAEDVQATLLELTARTLCDAIQQENGLAESEIYLCGGGALNTALRQRIAQCLPHCSVTDTTALGIAPDWVEAAAFAWLAHATLTGIPGNVPRVTGAQGPRILGAIYPA